MESIGTRSAARLYLREWREKRGLTQTQLAQRIGTTEGTISKKESTPGKVDVFWLNRFAEGLGVDVEELFHHPDRPSPNDLLRHASPEELRKAFEVIEVLRRVS